MKRLLTVALLSVLFFNLEAQINISLPENSGLKFLDYFYAPIEKLVNAKTRAERGIVNDSVKVENNQTMIAIPEGDGALRFGIAFPGNNNVELYALPGEKLNLNVNTLDPFTYSVTGSALMEGISEINELSYPMEARQKEIMANAKDGQPDSEALQAVYEEYLMELNNYISHNQNSPALIYAILNLDGEDMIEAYENLNDSQKSSVLYPLLNKQVDYVKASLEKERKQKEMQSGNIAAPEFTLMDLENKPVSLSDFRGKWVILDFWGSWCIWCIRGIPELKEAYEKYKDELVIIGIDCNESQEAWRAGVEKYQLPWVNVYCPEGNKLIQEYGIQGYPTKAIIDPEGKIRNITTGHNPEFYTILSELIGH